ncbi:MAG TPA: hypothetical protein DCO82_01230 [Alphaproteobacteria bacterium]|nr:hypothetical protein [Alphaproteobacteria bacterium]
MAGAVEDAPCSGNESMSAEKYAALHSGLIARKGEAQPTPPIRPEVFERPPQAAPQESPQTRTSCDSPGGVVRPERPSRLNSTDKSASIKALTLRIDPALYHRVHVAAAQLDWTSQDLIRAAIEAYLVHLGREVFPNCGCISGNNGCR